MSSFLPKGKHRYIMLALLAAGVILIAVGTAVTSCENRADPAAAKEDLSQYERECEARIEELCLSLAGVDNAKAFVTLERTTEKIYAQNTQSRSDSSSVQSSGEYPASALLLGEEYPKVRGVAVAVTGGDRPEVQKKIVELVSSALGISSSKVAVAESK